MNSVFVIYLLQFNFRLDFIFPFNLAQGCVKCQLNRIQWAKSLKIPFFDLFNWLLFANCTILLQILFIFKSAGEEDKKTHFFHKTFLFVSMVWRQHILLNQHYMSISACRFVQICFKTIPLEALEKKSDAVEKSDFTSLTLALFYSLCHSVCANAGRSNSILKL